VLTDAFGKLKSAAHANGFSNRLAICIRTENAIIKLVKAYNLATRISTINTVSADLHSVSLMQFRYMDDICFSSYDFDNMYNNLDIQRLIDAIHLLFKQFCSLDPNYEFLMLLTKQTNSDYNPNI
jgi:hypothetical protein